MSSNVRISSIGEDGVVSLDFYTDGGLYQNPALLINSHRSAGINQVASRVLPNLSSECIMVVRAFIMRLTPKM